MEVQVKCSTTIPNGSTLQAIGSGNRKEPSWFVI